jgi:hypothetical protein
MAQYKTRLTATIASSATVSDSITVPTNGRSLIGIIIPAAMTGSTLTFKASYDGTNYDPVYFESTLLSITIPTGARRFIALDPKYFDGALYLQLVSGSAEAATRTIELIFGR